MDRLSCPLYNIDLLRLCKYLSIVKMISSIFFEALTASHEANDVTTDIMLVRISRMGNSSTRASFLATLTRRILRGKSSRPK